MGDIGSTSGKDNSGHDLLRSKRALERRRRAAAEAQDRAQRLRRLTSMVEVKLGGALQRARNEGKDSEEVAALEKQLEEYAKEAADFDNEWRAAAEEERQALEELAHASDEFEDATVEPKVEAMKLRFEEHKLRATLSSASIVGIAATSGILLPDRPSHVVVLGIAFFCLFVSTGLSLSAMKKTSGYVENALVSGVTAESRGLLAWLTRHTFTIGLTVFGAFVVLNLMS